MGRVKGTIIKRTAKGLLLKHKGQFTPDFGNNKQVIRNVLPMQKKFRNSISGYIARLVKREQATDKKKH